MPERNEQISVLKPWPADKKVPVTKRDVAAVLRRWRKKMPAQIADLLGQAAATPEQEAAFLAEMAGRKDLLAEEADDAI